MQDDATPDREEDGPDDGVTVPRGEVEEAAREAAKGERAQRTFYISKEVVERLNGVVYWAQGFAIARAEQTGEDLTEYVPDSASSMVETAIWAEILRVEKAINKGRPFQPAGGKLRTGPGERGIRRLSEPRKKRD